MKQLKIGAYIRVSTEEQAALVDGSLDNQRYRINAFVDLKNVQEKGWGRVVDYYVDDGYSAKDTRRPAFQKMMWDLKKGKVDLILVTDLSRLSRNIPDFCEILEILKGNGASFLSIKEQFDTSTPAGKMMLYNMINLAQFEREQTAERVSLGCHARAMRGLLNGGMEILGYDKSEDLKNTYVVNECEAEQVRTIFKSFLENGSLSRTIKKLEELGIKPKAISKRKRKVVDRGLWTHQNLGDLLKRVAYIGMREVNRKNKNSESKTLKAHQRYQIVKASWPAIVPKELFDRVQLVLADNLFSERRRLKGAERRVFIASGIICCKECGRAMVGQSAHGANVVHRYYVHATSKGDDMSCSVRRVRAEEVEDVIGRHISTALKDGNYLNEVAKRIVGQGKNQRLDDRAAKARLKKELRDCEREMEAAFQLQLKAEAGTTAGKFVLQKLEKLGQKKEGLEKALAGLEESQTNVISLSDVRDDLEDRVTKVTKGWAKLPAPQKKQVLRRLFQKIAVGPQGLDLYYYSCASENEGTSGALSGNSESSAQVLAFAGQGRHSKPSIQNCVSARVAIPVRLERTTYCLEGSCSIQLSYGTEFILDRRKISLSLP